MHRWIKKIIVGGILCAPDYIFLDVNLHKMDGIECLQEIKKMEHLRNCDVIMFSTTADAKVMRQCLDLGASRFLIKPPRLTTLIEELARILKETHHES